MIGALMLAFGAIGTVKQNIHENILEYEFIESARSVYGDIYKVNGEKYLKGINEKVAVCPNCFGEDYAFNTRLDVNGDTLINNYGYVRDNENYADRTEATGLDNTTYLANANTSYVFRNNASRNLYIDKESGRRLCEWNGIYFDADTSSPVRFVDRNEIALFDTSIGYEKDPGKMTHPLIDLTKIWIANEVLKDKTGVGFWQFVVKEKRTIYYDVLSSILPGVSFEKEENFNPVAFREMCREICPKFKKNIGVISIGWMYKFHLPDTTFSMTEWKRRNMEPDEYRAII